MIDPGTRVRLVWSGDRPTGTIEGHSFIERLNGEDGLFYIVKLDRKFQGYIVGKRMFISAIVVHSSNVKVID